MCIYVHELTSSEYDRLEKLLRRPKTHVITARRALIIMASARGMKVPEIADLYHYSREHVRDVVHRYNSDGFESLLPRYRGGRPARFTPEHRSALIELAVTPPRELGYPFDQWTLARLQEAAMDQRIVKRISHETIRQVLQEAGISYQHARTP